MSSSKSSNSNPKGRGIAATGILYHAINSDGLIGRDFLTRVRIDGKRLVINVGPDKDFGQQLDLLARAQLRAGNSLAEVKEWVAHVLWERHLPDSPPPTATPALQAYRGARPQPDYTAAVLKLGSTCPQPVPGGVEPRQWDLNATILAAHHSLSDPIFTSTPCPSIGAMVQALIERSTHGITCPKSLHFYLQSLLNAVELVQYYRAGRPEEKPNRSGRTLNFREFGVMIDGRFQFTLDQPSTILDLKFAADFWEARLDPKRLRPGDNLDSYKRSAETELKQLSALFTESWALDAYDRARLRLRPGVAAMTGFHLRLRVPPPVPYCPTSAQVRAVHELMHDANKCGDFAGAMVLALGLRGLRHDEICNARLDWLEDSAYGLVLHVQPAADFVPKFGRSRQVVIPRWLYDWLKQTAAGDYLVANSKLAREQAAERTIVDLRRLGFDCDKPLHSLRGLFAAFLRATERRLDVILECMGHASIETLVKHYAGHPLASALVPLWHRKLTVTRRTEQLSLQFDAPEDDSLPLSVPPGVQPPPPAEPGDIPPADSPAE